MPHLVGRVEPLHGPPVQRLGEERDEPISNGWVEQFGVEARDSSGRWIGIGPAVAPHGTYSRGHFVQGCRRRVPVRRRVPTLSWAFGQERVEVAGGAGLQGGVWGAGQREVEEHEVQGSVTPPRPHTKVVGFQVAMRHTFAFQVADDLKQVVAEAVEQVEANPAVRGQSIGQCEAISIVGIPGGGKSKGRSAADPLDAEQLDDADVVELSGHGLRLVAVRRGPRPWRS